MNIIDVINNNDIDKLKLLINNNIDINYKYYGDTLLIRACRNGYKNIVKLLLKYKPDVNIQNYNGYTALIWNIINNNNKDKKDIVELLLKYNADVNIQDNYGYTALIYAVIINNKDIVELLLKYNAKINILNKYDDTALILACKEGYKDIVELLLEYNADINIPDNSGETALIMAQKYKYYDIKQLLLNHLYKCVYIINIYTLKIFYYDINMSNIIYNYIKK